MTNPSCSSLLLLLAAGSLAGCGVTADDTGAPVDTDPDAERDTDTEIDGGVAPVIRSVTLVPDPVRTNDLLAAVVDVGDEDSAQVALSYAWSVNGAVVTTGASNTLDGARWFDRDDEVIVTVTASDTSNEVSAASQPVIVQNSAPGVPVLTLGPDAADAGQALTCAIATPAADADEDELAYSFAWTLDGAAYDRAATADTESVVPGADVRAGQTWTCSAVASDGDLGGTAATATVETARCGDGSYEAVVMDAAPVAYWSLDEASGVFVDSVGGFDGRLVGTATRAATGLLDGGSAIDLTGGGYVEIPYDPALATDAFSVSMWLRVDGSISERMSPFSNRGSPYYLGWNLYTFGELQGMIGDGSAWEGVAGGTVTAGAVAHVVMTYDDAVGGLSLYVDGVLLDADNHGHALNPSAGLTIGALNDGGSWPFVGVIDGVALWDRALDASEVAALFGAGCE